MVALSSMARLYEGCPLIGAPRGNPSACAAGPRVTDALCRTLERYHPIWVNTHFNHPKELTPEAAEACDRLLRAGIPVGNQSVLLRGINDDPQTMKALREGLVRMRVRPYYCYQAQLLEGTEHFRVPVERGVEIFRALRGRTSGFAIPTYVLDTPYGKVPLGYPYLRAATATTSSWRPGTGTSGGRSTRPSPIYPASVGRR
jgi:L-lysine 2,3-aminomutase